MPAIRTLFPADWPVYRDLRLAALAESPAAFGSTLAAEAARPDDAWAARLAAPALGDYRHAWPYVAEVDGTPVGLAWIKLDAPDAASLYQVWVAPQARGQGVGAALMEAAIAWTRARGAKALHLDVTAGNGAAARLYRRTGFVDVGTPIPRPGTNLSDQVMVLALEG